MKHSSKQDQKIIEQAAYWATCLDDVKLSSKERKELATWLRKSPQHVKELLLAQAILTDANAIDPNKDISIDILLESQEADIISLETVTSAGTKAYTPQHYKRPLQKHFTPAINVAASLFVVVMIIGVFLISPLNNKQIIYATAVGEQRSLSLADGSVIHLNTQSKIQVRYDKGARNIDLLKGEALFNVAHNPERPFRVHTNSTITQALGTTFNVYLKRADTEVAVIEGKVTVKASIESPLDLGSKPLTGKASTTSIAQTTLIRGQRASVSETGSVTKSQTIDIQNITAWRQRKLVFEDASITEIINEFNRYNTVQIHLEETENIEPRFSGIFNADNLKAFLSTLKISGAIIDQPNEKNIIIIRFSSKQETEKI